MKVIHTYVSNSIVWKEQFYVMLLSALYAKKHYGNIHMYCSKVISDQLQGIEDIYSSVQVVPDIETSTYSVPKLNTYAAQKEPFLHLDHDSILFKNVNFKLSDSPFVFSHPDMKEIIGEKGLGLFSIFSDSKLVADFELIKKMYLELLGTLKDQLPNKGIPFDSIPNMALVYVNNPDEFSKAANQALSYYNRNKQILDAHDYGAHHLEQYLIHHLLFIENKQYRKAAKKYRTFLLPKVPLTLSVKQQERAKASIAATQFPFSFDTYNTYPHFNQKKVSTHTLEKPEDISKLFGNHFGGYIHLSYLQWYQILQPYIINEIVTNFGEKYIRSVHNYFKKEYHGGVLPTKSEGEKLYEDLTGFSFD